MLGPRIAALRHDAGWSQAELAKKLRVSASAIGMYEQSRREPSADTLDKIPFLNQTGCWDSRQNSCILALPDQNMGS